MKGNRGFTNKAKSGVKALAAGWRRAAERARLDKSSAKKQQSVRNQSGRQGRRRG